MSSGFDPHFLHRFYKTLIVFNYFSIMKLSVGEIFLNCFMTWKPGLNFINILRTTFAHAYPKNVKRYWQIDWILLLLGATGVKVIRNMLVKLSPRVKKACFKYSLIESISFLDFRLLRVSTESDFQIWIWTGKFSVVFFNFVKQIQK